MSQNAKTISKISKSAKTKVVSKALKTNRSRYTNSPIDRILHLQRTIGNQAVQNLYQSGAIQAKLGIGRANDKYEQEADSVADRVMSMPEPAIQST